MTQVRARIARVRRLVAMGLVMQFLLPPIPVSASIVVDPSNPDVRTERTGTGVDVVEIKSPDSGGFSHNKFSDYNVSEQGVVINNSATFGTSESGVFVRGNPNLSSGHEAGSILFEVTGKQESQIRGAQEIVGRRASFILANPNGVYVSGGRFVNTSRLTMSTGTPQFGPDGLELAVRDGVVRL